MVNDKSDSVLVERAIEGNGDSFTELCRRYYGPLVAIADAILGDRHLAEDAAQQALAKAAFRLPNLRKPEQFGAWLATICRNMARDLLRTAERQRVARASCPCSIASETRTGHPRHESGPPNDDVGEAVREALRCLKPSAREIIYLRFYDGLPYEQISAVLGISEQAINGRLRRAKRTLAKCLRRQGLDEVQI